MRRVAWPSAAVPLGSTSQLALQPPDRVAQPVDELGLDRVLDDRVAVDVDPGEMIENRGFGERHHDTIADMEPLDNPVWHALTGPQAQFSEGSSLALRYQTDVAVFAALPDDVGPDAWAALARLVGPGGAHVIFRPAPRSQVPAGWEVTDPDELAADGRDRADRRARRHVRASSARADVARHARPRRAHACPVRSRNAPSSSARISGCRAESGRRSRRDGGRTRPSRRATPS